MSELARAALARTYIPMPQWGDHGGWGCRCSMCVHDQSWTGVADRIDAVYLAALDAIDGGLAGEDL